MLAKDKKDAVEFTRGGGTTTGTDLGGTLSSLESSRVRRFAPLLTEQIVLRVKEAEGALEQRADELTKAQGAWREVYGVRSEDNRLRRATFVGRLFHSERQPSEEETALLQEANRTREEWLEANARIESLIADHLAAHDPGFAREREELAFLTGRNAPDGVAAGLSAAMYAQSVGNQIDLFRELCKQAGTGTTEQENG